MSWPYECGWGEQFSTKDMDLDSWGFSQLSRVFPSLSSGSYLSMLTAQMLRPNPKSHRPQKSVNAKFKRLLALLHAGKLVKEERASGMAKVKGSSGRLTAPA